MVEREELAQRLRWSADNLDDSGGESASPYHAALMREAADALMRKLPEPRSAEWEAMVERARKAYFSEGNRTSFDAALRAALALDQPHRENDERPEEQP